MPGSVENLQLPSAQIDDLLIVNVRSNFPWTRRVRSGIEALRQRAADLVGRDLRLRVFPRALGILAGKVSIHSVNRMEFPVPAHMIVMRMRVQHNYGKFRQFLYDLL